MKKIFTKKHCPKFCKEKGCYITKEPNSIMGKKYPNLSVIHCKSLERASGIAMGMMKKIL